ncbi:hypothetical protein HOLleu_09311 [Holothuria leucospilota]|uniref:Uncharacterized protein n=1 Tax=Holothuria leucospilota TaxID=206669 RepID=A0A9Q1HIJ2_HOLLE|nr:hypothetical protein HOLleu_09311 [Holothuria leucospilota]
MSIHHHFNKDSQSTAEVSPHEELIGSLKPPSTWTPKIQNAYLQKFWQLRSNKDIIIKPADKGSAVVVMSVTDYISEGERQLSNTSIYKPLTHDATRDPFTKRYKQTVDSLDFGPRNKIDALVPKHTSCPNLYFTCFPKFTQSK